MDTCTACPLEVRALYATAYNLLNAIDEKDSLRTPRKIEDLREAVSQIKPLVQAHFEANHHKR